MANARPFDHQVTVSGQISTDEVAGLAAQGFVMLINNRPDGEEPNQPAAKDIEAAAEKAGLAYRYIPVVRGLGPADIAEMAEAIEAAQDKPVFAFCRSGNRSSLLTALARRRHGVSRSDVEQALRNAGSDPTHIDHLL